MRFYTHSLPSLVLFGLLLIVHLVYADTPNPSADKSDADESDATQEESVLVTPPAEEDDLWAIPPSQVGAEVVDFNKESGPPAFEWNRLEREQSSDHIFIEHHGYLRFRADLMHHFDLGTYSVAEKRGTSRYLPPLTNGSAQVKQLSESLSSANIRFRYTPTLHITENLRIEAMMDLPDNLILGSTPDGGPMSIYQRPDVLLDSLSDSQRPLDQALRVKNISGTWESELARVSFGRLPHHWGLGILANSGTCLDCDFGDSIDRLEVTTQLFDIYLSLSWDFVSEGPTGYGLIDQVMGQPWDWDQRDDVDQYTISLGQRAASPKEIKLRKAHLKEGKSSLDWGFYAILRQQKNAAAFEDLESAQASPSSPDPDEERWTVYPTGMNLFIPDLYLHWTHHPKASRQYNLKAEVVGLFGKIEQVPLATFAAQDPIACDDPILSLSECPLSQHYNTGERDISAWGYAVEFDAKVDNILWGIHHGGASGDQNSGFFGEDALFNPQERDSALNGFRFDRDYIVDLILFREILGGVHNALYFSPYVGYEVEKKKDTFWGMKLSMLYGMAVNKEYTAGGQQGLGVEVDIEAYIYDLNRFRLSLAYGALFPLDGLNLLNQQRTEVLQFSSTAQTLQLNLGLMF